LSLPILTNIIISGAAKAAAPKSNGGKEMANLIIGDILKDVWGYEQTNVDFYEVVKVTEKTATVRTLHHSQ
jgi:hypothetical protein